MVRDLVDAAINMVRTEREDEVYPQAEQRADERLLDLLLPPLAPTARRRRPRRRTRLGALGVRRSAPSGQARPEQAPRPPRRSAASARARSSAQLLPDGQLDDREVEIEVTPAELPDARHDAAAAGAWRAPDFNFTEMLQEMLPKRKKRRTVKVPEARRILVDEELKKLVDMDDVVNEALDRVENHGIIFIDEIDKIAGERGQAGGPDVSREGVQRDLLPIVEGSTVQTRYGYVRTDHILFIAAGAFHVSKPSDLIPELQGRFPIRVELKPLTEQDFVRIMTEPENALTKQYQALVAAEGAKLEFTADGIAEIARMAVHGERPDGEHRRAPAPHRHGDADGGGAVRAARTTREADRVRRGGGPGAAVEDRERRRPAAVHPVATCRPRTRIVALLAGLIPRPENRNPMRGPRSSVCRIHARITVAELSFDQAPTAWSVEYNPAAQGACHGRPPLWTD